MNFAHPELLHALWLLPLYVGLLIVREKRYQKRLQQFASIRALAGLLPAILPGRLLIKNALLTLTFVLIIVAIARPRWGFEWREVSHKGIDIMVAMDVSRSMRAQDIKPNRLERAKREVIDLIRVLHGDRIGLVAFAGQAFVQCPLTVDYRMMQLFLDNLAEDLIPVQGTSLAAAIDLGFKALNEGSPGTSSGKVLILITDGEDQESQLPEQITAAKNGGIKIFTVGIGSREGAPIPEANGGFVKDSAGRMVISRLGDSTLRQVAEETGGRYVAATEGEMGLDQIYRQVITATTDSIDFKTTREQIWYERFQWFTGLALIFLILEWFLPKYSLKKTRG